MNFSALELILTTTNKQANTRTAAVGNPGELAQTDSCSGKNGNSSWVHMNGASGNGDGGPKPNTGKKFRVLTREETS